MFILRPRLGALTYIIALKTLTMPSVHSHMHFLKEAQLYEQVKPYSLRFPPPDGLLQSNVQRERHDIEFHDIRHAGSFTLDSNGFEVIAAPSQMSYQDFDDKRQISKVYLPEMCGYLKKMLQASHILALDFSVRF